ncbi:hypothetical protein [Enterovirga sp. CN4-39]|uniref:hypothetical protein n=1 Tax=Enterovirga sp. CN4-39 TaxID=3400910 RepID=UPI003C00AE5D
MVLREARVRDPDAVTVTLTYLGSDEVGFVELPDRYVAREVDGHLVSGTAPLAPDAISFAKAEAARIGCDLAIIDPDGLWTSAWGALETASDLHEPA